MSDDDQGFLAKGHSVPEDKSETESYDGDGFESETDESDEYGYAGVDPIYARRPTSHLYSPDGNNSDADSDG